MKITIIPEDGKVGVDRDFRDVDTTDIDPAIHAIQFDDVTGEGHVEYKARGAKHHKITDISEVQVFLDRWQAAAPPPPPPPGPPPKKPIDMLLEYVATKPDAPKEIVDEVNRRKGR